MENNYKEGAVIAINKPLGWTSFDVVNKVRHLLYKFCGEKIKTGHAGTLDPLATGLLILCTGKMTKKLSEYQACEKEYAGVIMLGATTPSYDLETETDQKFETDHITKEHVKNAVKKFTGRFLQIPPAFSARKVNGQRAYIQARKNEKVEMLPSEVEVFSFDVTGISIPEIAFKIVCSKGTYIRSIASDFGKALNSGAYLKMLCRTRIGNIKLENSFTIEEFEKILFESYAINQ